MSYGFPCITLSDGRGVTASQIYIDETYGAMLMGIPSDPVNESILEMVPFEMQRRFGTTRIVIVPPQIRRGRPIELGPPRGVIEEAFIPPVRIAARFYSDAFAVGETYSQLVVVWYQDSLGPLVGDHARECMEALNWNELAEDFSF
jgi:hypothetical protein